MRTIVYKLGGSLLDLPDLASRLSAVIQHNPETRPLLIVGGGETVDRVRNWDRIHHLGEERSHQLALQAMVFNALFLQKILPDSRLITTRSEAVSVWKSSMIPILNSLAFLRTEEQGNASPLPHHWDVTSDSIAAWVTLNWPTDGLVLLKSVDRPFSLAEDQSKPIAGSGVVDAYFSHLATRLPYLEWINLRAKNRSAELCGESDQSL